MPSFREVTTCWLKQNSVENVDCNLLFLNIGDIEIKELTSEKIKVCLIDLYDNKKLRGIVYASYEKCLADICQYALYSGYITEIPKLEHRSESAPNLYNQPDSAAMQLLLSHEDYTPIGTALRLAWYCGLRRNEITFLLWEQVDFEKLQLVLQDRSIPLTYDMAEYLKCLYKKNAQYSEYVLISQRKSAPMAEQSVSALARQALDKYSQNNVRLNDLRSDYIVQELREKSLQYVSYISGVDLPSLRQHYLPYVGNRVAIRYDDKPQITQQVGEKLWDFIEKEKASMSGLSLRFVWLLGIPVSVLPLLTWDIIDFNKAVITFIDRTIKIPDDFTHILYAEKNERDGEYNNIILNESKRKPTDSIFLQKAVQQALIRNGMAGITLSDLQNDYWKHHYSELKNLIDSGVLDLPATRVSEVYSVPKCFPSELVKPPKDELLDYLKANGAVDYKTLKDVLNFSDKEILLLLKDCRETGEIVRIGVRYFLPDMIVQREKQKDVILEYVKKNQPVTSAELTKLLGLVERRQIFWVINPMLQSGELIRASKNKYCMPEDSVNLETA